MKNLRTPVAAEYIGVEPPTLRRWRHEGVDPRSLKLQGVVVYPKEELDRWLNEQKASQWGEDAVAA